jgi:hypothetical protein
VKAKWTPRIKNNEAANNSSKTDGSKLNNKGHTSAAPFDWRQELKNKEKAKQQEMMKETCIGTPDYAEPPKPKVLNWRDDLKNFEEPASALDKWKSAEGSVVLKKKRPPPSKPKVKEQQVEEQCTCNIGTCKKHPKFALKSARGKKSDPANAKNNTGLKRSNTTICKSEEVKTIKPRSSSVKPESKPKKYITKIINFVAIKVLVEDDEKRKRDEAFKKGIEKEEQAINKIKKEEPKKVSPVRELRVPKKERTPPEPVIEPPAPQLTPPPPEPSFIKKLLTPKSSPKMIKKSPPSPKILSKILPISKQKPVAVIEPKKPKKASCNMASKIFGIKSPKLRTRVKYESPEKITKPVAPKPQEEIKIRPFKCTAHQPNVVTDAIFFGNR